MSKRVYVSRNISVITAQEDTPVSLRIQVSAATVKALHARLQQAYRKDDVRLVRRTTVLIDLLVHHVPMAVLCERWDLIDVQKMNREFRIGVDEQTGVCLQKHFGYNCTGGYTRESQNTGQCCDSQSVTR